VFQAHPPRDMVIVSRIDGEDRPLPAEDPCAGVESGGACLRPLRAMLVTTGRSSGVGGGPGPDRYTDQARTGQKGFHGCLKGDCENRKGSGIDPPGILSDREGSAAEGGRLRTSPTRYHAIRTTNG